MSRHKSQSEPVVQHESLDIVHDLEVLKPEDFELSEKERRAVKSVVDWEKRSAETPWVLGQPVQR